MEKQSTETETRMVVTTDKLRKIGQRIKKLMSNRKKMFETPIMHVDIINNQILPQVPNSQLMH